jgi:hypothetical protein
MNTQYSGVTIQGREAAGRMLSPNFPHHDASSAERSGHRHQAAAQELLSKDVIRSEIVPQSPEVAGLPLKCKPSDAKFSPADAAAQADDVYCLLDSSSSSMSSDGEPTNLSPSFMRMRNDGAVLAAAGHGASSIMRAIDAIKDGSRQSSAVKLHTRTPEAGNGLPYAGLIDSETNSFRFAPGTSSSHFVRHSPSDAINSLLPRLYPVSAPEMLIKRYWDQKKGCWSQRWAAAASERQAAASAASKKKNGVSFTVDTNVSPSEVDIHSGSSSRYRYVDSAATTASSMMSPPSFSASAAAFDSSKISASPSVRRGHEDGPPSKGDGAGSFRSGISFLGHDAKSIAATATAPHMWRSWGAAAVRVHARHAVSAACLYREIRSHAENLDEALHHLAESCSVWRHGYSVLQSRCAATSQTLHIFRAMRVLFNAWKQVVNVRTFTLAAARQRALRLPKLKQLLHSWRLLCLSSRARSAVATMFTTR